MNRENKMGCLGSEYSDYLEGGGEPWTNRMFFGCLSFTRRLQERGGCPPRCSLCFIDQVIFEMQKVAAVAGVLLKKNVLNL